MSSKLIPSNPSDVMVIRNVTQNVVTLSVPFARLGKLKVGGRGTIVKLTSGALAVFSPVALTPEVKAKVAEMGGKLQYIVAPDTEHHIFISDWMGSYPNANIIAPEGLHEKREKVTNDPKIGKHAFGTIFKGEGKREVKISPEFDADFEYEYLEGTPNKELVFFYKPDRVLIEADFLWNLPPTEQYSRTKEGASSGAIAGFISGLQSTEGEAKGQKRFLWHLLSRSNRKSFNDSVKRIGAWDFVTIIPCHGDTIEGTGKQVYNKVFEWHLKAKE